MKFTIGIPAFKATYLKDCINSILFQNYSNFEIIVVNDASPEDIDNIINEFKSDKIRYYKNYKNFGAVNVVDNWNKCLSYAQGDYFILMGDDDKMCANYLSEFKNLINKYPDCNIYHCRTIIINENSIPVRLTEPRPEIESAYDSILERIKGNRTFFISDYVYNTKALKENGGFYKLPLAWGSDDISSYIAALKSGIAHTNNPVFMYRENSQTISATGNIHLKMDAILLEEKWFKSFLQRLPSNSIDTLLKVNIKKEIKLSIQKKKIRTLYSSTSFTLSSLFFSWFFKRRRYNLSIEELIYAYLMSIKEKRKRKYE